MKYDTLLNLHIAHEGSPITTDATGKSWVEVPVGDDLGGHIDTVRRVATVKDWPVIERNGKLLIPTYAYDRVVVAGLRCAAPAIVPGPGKDYFGGKTQQEALRDLMHEHSLSGAQVGTLVGVDGRTVRRWLAPEDQGGYRAMPYASWHTLLSRVSHSQSSAL